MLPFAGLERRLGYVSELPIFIPKHPPSGGALALAWVCTIRVPRCALVCLLWQNTQFIVLDAHAE